MSPDKPKMNSEPSNASAQGVDKDPKDEKGKSNEVSDYDLKAKKIDADPEEERSKEDAREK
jgi:hypothetical protein